MLKPSGFTEICVPDLKIVMKHVAATDMDIEDTLYVSPMGPITVCDVIYGFGKQIEDSGVDFYAHKTGFTSSSLITAVEQAGFVQAVIAPPATVFEVRVLGFKMEPTRAQRRLLSV